MQDQQDTPLRYRVDPETGCWVWTAASTSQGYGMAYTVGGQKATAHRAVYELLVGAIPKSKHLHHRCAVKRCVNPTHLQLVDPADHQAVERDVENREARARELRGNGMTYEQIGKVLACSKTTVYRLVNDGYKRANVEYHRERSEHYRELRRRYHREHYDRQRVCDECGGRMVGRGGTGVCAGCRRAAIDRRKETIAEMWRAGKAVSAIAATLDSSAGSIQVEVFRMRRDGWDLPYRRRSSKLADAA